MRVLPLLAALLLCAIPRAAIASPAPISLSSPERAGHGVEPPNLGAPRPELVTGERRTARFRVLHTERTRKAAAQLAERLEAERDAFVAILGRDWPGITEVRLGAGRAELEGLALPGGRPPSWAIALAYPSHGIILLDALQLSSAEGNETLRHELAHVALGGIGAGWPRWFQEGLAQHLTGERTSLAHYTTLFGAVHGERILAFDDLTQGWPERPIDVELAYAQSASFVGWLSERHGGAGLGAILDHVAAGAPFPIAFARAFETSLRLEEEAWRETLPARYGWMPWVMVGSSALSLAALLCVVGFVLRRRRLAARLAQMEQEEESEERARLQLEAELLALERQAEEEAAAREDASTHGREGAQDDELPRRGKDLLH